MRCSICEALPNKPPLTIDSHIANIPLGLDRPSHVKAQVWKCSFCGSYTARQSEFESNLYSTESTCFSASLSTLSISADIYPYSSSLLPVKLHKYINGRNFVDYGCGAGYFASQLSKISSSVVGIDLDPNAVKSVNSLGIECILGDMSELASVAFDSVAMVGVLEHFESPMTSLSDLISLASGDKSTFLLYYPNVNSLSRIASFFSSHSWDMFLEPGHLSFPSHSSITKFFHSRNYKLVKYWTTSSVVRGKLAFIPTRYPWLESLVLKATKNSKIFRFFYLSFYRFLDLVKLGDIQCYCFVRKGARHVHD